MIRFFYTLVLFLITPFFLPSLYKSKQGKPSVGKRWKEHFGMTPNINNPDNLPVIWIHAVSVGEVQAAIPLIKALSTSKPDHKIIITTTTSTGAKQAEVISGIAEHRYMPLDFSFCVRLFINKVKPKQLLIIETELWPNTLASAKKAGVSISIVNARLSEKSLKGYLKLKALVKHMLDSIDLIICQHEDDKERFLKLGARQKSLAVSGSIKFDIHIEEQIKIKGLELRQKLGLDRPVWIAASTHEGEDSIILSAHRIVLDSVANAILILVPRHPERFKAVEILSRKEFLTVSRTSGETIEQATIVYLGDTMGEMLILLEASDICFMGGSLIGDKVGGHNLLEPAALGKPTLTGPSYFNFTDITNQLISTGGCQVIRSDIELANSIIDLIESPSQQAEQGMSAYKVVEQNRGALKKTLSYILENTL
ncbi:lipid IV(A) 3-deoxy-D-manno-octulosonic acid transferase [Vibrio hepatarius]|uniref:lipid IV(A) 3-deoxy-D-manno-octulosonic acid transferase n=1 Tax=Vibrio hepatarius TaxID=171383 RepID=UPI001C08F848|nr:lipid IV(A) 3-deoxy-D-manno-octulosonic acid transferase [Vibrio hepatarius]